MNTAEAAKIAERNTPLQTCSHKPLAFPPKPGLMSVASGVGENEANATAVECIAVKRVEGKSDRVVCAAVERLLTKWLVRAYLRKQMESNERSTDAEQPAERIAS